MDSETKQALIIMAIIYSAIIIGAFFLFLSLGIILPAFGQVPIDSVLQDYKDRGLEGCEVWQIHYAMFTPLRIELEYEFATVRDPKISSNDPQSDVDVFSTPTKMNIVTNSTDFHTIDLLINYDDQTSRDRRVDYRIYTNDGLLTQEGNWHDTGTYFCKTLTFWSEPAPEFPTPKEVREQERAFFDEELKDIKTNQDESEGFFGVVLMIVLGVGIMVGILVVTNYFNQKSMQKPINEAKALMVAETKKLKNTRDNLTNTIQLWDLDKINMMSELKEMIKGFVSLSYSKGKVKQLEDAFVKPTKLVLDSTNEETSVDEVELVVGGEQPKSEASGLDLTKKAKKLASSLFKRGSKEGEPMTIEEMIDEWQKRPREENQKEYEELAKLYEKNQTKDDWIILTALHKVMLKQI